jgi:hypothetical protein
MTEMQENPKGERETGARNEKRRHERRQLDPSVPNTKEFFTSLCECEGLLKQRSPGTLSRMRWKLGGRLSRTNGLAGTTQR